VDLVPFGCLTELGAKRERGGAPSCIYLALFLLLMNRGPTDQPHIFLSRDQPGLKAESESQPSKLHVVYSAGPGPYEVLLPCTAPSLPHVHKGPNTQPQSSTYVLPQPSYFFATHDTHMHAPRSPRPASSSPLAVPGPGHPGHVPGLHAERWSYLYVHNTI
jgi:hypothetical protein